MPSPLATTRSSGWLLITWFWFPVVTESAKRAFIAGSSKHGKSRRAWVAASWLIA